MRSGYSIRMPSVQPSPRTHYYITSTVPGGGHFMLPALDYLSDTPVPRLIEAHDSIFIAGETFRGMQVIVYRCAFLKILGKTTLVDHSMRAYPKFDR